MKKNEPKYIEGKNLSLDNWLELIRTNPKGVLFENYMFPSDLLKEQFITNIHKYDEKTVLTVLHSFLDFGPSLGSDEFNFQYLIQKIKSNSKETIEQIKKDPYYQRLLKYYASKGKMPIYDSILWILDLLPHNPRETLDVINAFSTVHIGHLPDGRIHGLFDAETVIRARHFHAQVDISILYSLKPLEFEHLIEALYYKMGYKTQMTKITHDGGRDIIAIGIKPGKKERNLIQCKRVKDNVGIEEANKIFGPISDEKATKGTIVTTSAFTPDAKKFANRNPRLELIDQQSLIPLLNEFLGTTWPIYIRFYIDESEKRHPEEKRV